MNNNELTYNELEESELIPHKWCSIDSHDHTDPEICFKLKVWKEQCSFGEKVLQYVQKLNYGLAGDSCLEELTLSKNNLERLNRMDPKKDLGDSRDRRRSSLVDFFRFYIEGQPLIIEVGDTIPSGKLFKWAIETNGNIVNTIDIEDYTNSSVLEASVENNNNRVVHSPAITLNNSGQSHSWRGKANVTGGDDVYSPIFTVRAEYASFWGATTYLFPSQNDGATNRFYANNLTKGFASEDSPFVLETGTTSLNFVILVPPGKTVASIIDIMNLNIDLINDYVQSTIIVNDANGNPIAYSMYMLSLQGPYINSAKHIITIN